MGLLLAERSGVTLEQAARRRALADAYAEVTAGERVELAEGLLIPARLLWAHVAHHLRSAAQARRGAGFQAQCTCGWRSSPYTTAGMAGSVWDRHRAEAAEQEERPR